MIYQEKIINLLNKLLKDEISAATSYLAMAEEANNANLAKELRDHASDEFDHFKRIIQFMYNHSLGTYISYDFDSNVTKNYPNNTESILVFVQDLEQNAIDNYRYGIELAKENEDVETLEFFKSIMKEEIEHFDDLIVFTGMPRKIKSFKDKIFSYISSQN